MKTKKLNLKDTQYAIDKLKTIFSIQLAKKLNLTRVSAPLFLKKSSGLNDGLAGEKPVSFLSKDINEELEIVHSLAKWKRDALLKYGFSIHEGIYADMNAIRKEEILDNIHSIYVDQWDWELIINKEERTINYLKKIVRKIYSALKNTEKNINKIYPILKNKLAKNIFFISSNKLYDLYPNESPSKREYLIAKKYKSVFIYQIGNNLPDGIPHSKRAKDYDDWMLNGDIILYDEVNDNALEISSMGIRVNKESLIKQFNLPEDKISAISPYHFKIINNILPLTIGGGIGQSRIAMFLLEKAHIGEVQVSVWDDKNIEKANENNIILL
ncbi:aspartate--ammonia ligase [Metamycoplasma buccale]|uniref:aspartate--ammonia ligase n=1 Tax=Metamycoplasma buccale TaxID=55602 RepID=UPI00398F0B6E